MIVRFTCACGRTLVYEKPCGRPLEKCDECRRESNREAARRSHEAKTVEQRRASRTDWRRRNPTAQRESARQWAKRNRANVTANTQAYRARKAGAFVEHVDRDVLWLMDGGICGVCGKRVARDGSFHVDHIVPLSKGGQHSYANCQIAHGRCNQRKNARLATAADAGVTP